MRIVLTRHAQEAMVERGVTRELVERPIRRGSKTKQTDELLATYGYVRVAYYVRGDTAVVKTVMIERGLSR